jgi:hypothetical protein
MKRLSIFVGLALGLCLPLTLRAADERKMTVVDYFLRLPDKTLEAPPRAWLGNPQVIDKQNGYISITGDGVQPSFQVALFRYRDPARAGLLALCQGELEGEKSLFLDFFEMGSDGKMHKTRRSIFPVKDAGNGQGNWTFELPRQGRTVLVRSLKTKKILHRVTWSGEKFVE